VRTCAVIGAFGNYGGVAACLASKNHRVSIVQDTEDLQPIDVLRRQGPHPYRDLFDAFNRRPVLTIVNGIHEEFRFEPATSDYTSILDADILLLTVPSLFHEAIGERLRGLRWKRPLTVVTFTDRSLGAYACWRAAGSPASWRLVGLSATPYLARRHSLPFTSRLLGPKGSVLMASYPRGSEEESGRTLEALIPGHADFRIVPSMLELGMSSNPALLHAVHELAIMEHIVAGERVPMYDPAFFTPAVEARILAVCAERMEIAKAYGLTAQPYASYEQTAYTTPQWHFATTLENRNGNPMFRGLLSPAGLRQAKGVESVYCSLSLWESMARHAAIPLRAIPAVIDEWSAWCRTDLRRIGRTVERLCLSPGGTAP
jgi:hypothetical protein